MEKSGKKVAVIGAGIGGLAICARLASKCYDITCFESGSTFGGKLTSFEKNGFRFDAGPSLFTLPELVDDVFLSAGKNPRDYYNYKQKETICNYFFNDGLKFTAHAKESTFIRECAKTFNVPETTVQKYIRNSKKKYTRVGEFFTSQPIHKKSSWFNPKLLKALMSIPTYGLFTNMNAFNQKKLKNQNLVQYFNRYATYNGSNPYKTPALLTMIPHLEHGIGTFIPQNGMYDISSSIYRLCVDSGVKFEFNSPVTKINYKKNIVTGLVCNGNTYDFDTIIGNGDIAGFYSRLLPDEFMPTKIKNQERSSSAIIFYWGIKREFPELDLHNIFFSSDYKKEFDCIFGNKLFHDPTVYVNITSKDIKKDAPANCENWFVMINVPANKGYFNEELKQKARTYILEKLNRMLNVNLENEIVVEESLDPITIESKTGSLYGSIYGTSSNSKTAAFNRHANYSKHFKNLYFCGGSVHPGGGIPLCLNSAKIVSELMG